MEPKKRPGVQRKPPQTKIGMKLKKARVKVGMNREQATGAANELLPEQLQFAPVTLTRFESGEIREPGLEKIAALAIIYRMPLKDFDIDLRTNAATLNRLYARMCAPWESNPEPAGDEYDQLSLIDDSFRPFALTA